MTQGKVEAKLYGPRRERRSKMRLSDLHRMVEEVVRERIGENKIKATKRASARKRIAK